MAYREFYDPSVVGGATYQPFIGQGVSQLFEAISAEKKKRAIKADQFQVDLNQGYFENDERLKNELARSLTEEGKHRIRNNIGFDADYNKRRANAVTLANDSKIQYTRWQDDLKSINQRSIDDKYYNPQNDIELLRDATHGKNNDVNFYTRGERLTEAEQKLGKDPKSFRVTEYTADYVKNLGTTEKIKSTGNPNTSNTRQNKSTFWDDKTGAPGVTDKHAIDYLKSRQDGAVQRYHENEVNEELDSEIKAMRKSGDPRTSWMNGMSDLDVKNELINDPSKNILNREDFGIRVREKAKDRLRQANSIQQKVDVEQKKDLSQTGGLYNNDAIAHSDTYYHEDIGNKSMARVPTDNPQDALRRTGERNGAPGGILMINKGTTTGKPITFESGSSNIYNISSGTKQQARGNSTFNLTGYQVQAYTKDGDPVVINAASPEEFKQAIQKIPYSKMANMEPEMKIALKGYSLNKGKMLGDIRVSTYNLNQELAKARDNGDNEKVSQLEGRLQELQDFRDGLNQDADDYTDDDVLNAAARNGITAIRMDQLVKGDKADLDKINNITNGLNLSNKGKWSRDMQEAADLYSQRYREAAAAGFQDKGRKPKSAPKSTGVKTVSTQAEYDALPSGAEYVGPDGTKRRKK